MKGCRNLIDSGTPIFGVRRLTEGEVVSISWDGELPDSLTRYRMGAFKDGKYIRNSNYAHQHLDAAAQQSIQRVLDMLTPATPAVTLDMLETIDKEMTP